MVGCFSVFATRCGFGDALESLAIFTCPITRKENPRPGCLQQYNCWPFRIIGFAPSSLFKGSQVVFHQSEQLFIQGILQMMEYLCVPFEDRSCKTAFPCPQYSKCNVHQSWHFGGAVKDCCPTFRAETALNMIGTLVDLERRTSLAIKTTAVRPHDSVVRDVQCP